VVFVKREKPAGEATSKGKGLGTRAKMIAVTTAAIVMIPSDRHGSRMHHPRNRRAGHVASPELALREATKVAARTIRVALQWCGASAVIAGK